MRTSAKARPPESEIGAGIRIKPAHQVDIEAIFAREGVAPIYQELRPDGNISYWFGKEQVAALAARALLEKIPLHYWAHYAVIGDPPAI